MQKIPNGAIVLDSAYVYDQGSKKTVNGWQTLYKRTLTIKLFVGVLFNAASQEATSKEFYVEPYKRFAVLIDLAVVSTPTDIYFDFEFSQDQVNWFKYITGPWGDLRYEDSAGAKKEYLVGDCIASWMRVRAISSGCEAGKTFLVNLTVNLES